ncbi:MAG: AAA family ATPase [Armatimonadota bacterium]
MLIEFSVTNYRSFKDRVTLSMEASADKSHPENTFQPEGGNYPRLLKAAVVYGANASGKSNLVKALTFMRQYVCTSQTLLTEGRIGTSSLPLTPIPFKLDHITENQPSTFEVEFISKGERYQYQFTVDVEGVQHERLLNISVKKKLVFERFGDGTISYGASWKHRQSQQLLQQFILNAPKTLVVSAGATIKAEMTQPVYSWFVVRLDYILDESDVSVEKRFTLDLLDKDEQFRALFNRFIQAADLGIEQFDHRRINAGSLEEIKSVPKKMLDKMLAQLPDEANPTDYSFEHFSTIHRLPDGTTVKFDPEEDESAGTNRLFALAGTWYFNIIMGSTLIVDELELRLHPKLCQFLMQLALEAPACQLIVTTHDSSLLDSGLLRRDQIWFTEKKPNGATDLYSLWDINLEKSVRNSENFRRGYLQGRYGAIPFIGELNFGETVAAQSK